MSPSSASNGLLDHFLVFFIIEYKEMIFCPESVLILLFYGFTLG